MMRTLVSLLSLSVWIVASEARAYPEFVRHGYFSCTSCHVAPTGGSTLTDYGRSFATEKLTTWGKEGEDRAGHGKIPPLPEWLIVGGNFRQAQTLVETSRARSGRWIPMQRDVDLCIKVSITWTCATGGLLPKPKDDGNAAYGLRKVFERIDLGENFVVRAGRFFPRYGLMIANHTSPIRRGLGFEQGNETDQLEVTFTSEMLEATVYRDFGRKLRMKGDDSDSNEAFDPGFGLTAATLIGTSSRLGMSYRHVAHDDTVDQWAGPYAAIGFTPTTFVLAEVDQRATITRHPDGDEPKIARSAVSHLKVGHEFVTGWVTYALHEANVPNISAQNTRKDTFGLGSQWFPRPHFEIEGFYGYLLQRQTYSYAAVGYLILHYYL